MIVVFLQNAWAHPSSVSAMRESRRVWLYALALSRSGRRLVHLLGESFTSDEQYHLDNLTKEIGLSSNSNHKPQPHHIKAVIAEHDPTLVVGCGNSCAATLPTIWSGPLLLVPHPAFRLLTNDLYIEGRRLIELPTVDRLILRQLRGSFTINTIP